MPEYIQTTEQIQNPSGKTLLIATHNSGKMEEMAALLRPYGIGSVSAAAFDLPSPHESAATFVGNARIKAHAAAKGSGLIALGDDSGITIDALAGAPGIHTADWAETSKGRDFMHAMARTHAALQSRKAPQPWHAQFRCTLVLAWPDGRDIACEGIVHGHLVWPPKGKTGFGYDPMFIPQNHTKTFGEMRFEEKNRISHRQRAVSALMDICLGTGL